MEIKKEKPHDQYGGTLHAACRLQYAVGKCEWELDGWEESAAEDSSDMGRFSGESGIGEGLKEWPEEYSCCGVQELSGYLYEHTSVSASPYASAEITIKDYEGEQLETEWDEPSAFQFSGEADVTWQFYNSLAEMEAVLNEAAMQERDENSLHFLYYTFPMTGDNHVLDLYQALKRRFDTEEHPLLVWSEDDGKLLQFIQETMEEIEGYIFPVWITELPKSIFM